MLGNHACILTLFEAAVRPSLALGLGLALALVSSWSVLDEYGNWMRTVLGRLLDFGYGLSQSIEEITAVRTRVSKWHSGWYSIS